ncbi:MDR family oxidoreductase [beta proteobacterium MWH-UniP1]
MKDFNAILINKTETSYTAGVQHVNDSALTTTNEHDVLVKVDYSTINYKDGLAITGKSPIIRKFPMIPGIDFTGTVEQSDHPLFKAGDQVILNGWGVGESHPGGLAQYAKVKGDWLIKKPAQFSSKQAMAIGTAGYTAMLCILALERHGVKPSDGEVLVTGAAGGVGSVAIAVLAKLGFHVVASTGRTQEADYLKSLGAKEVIDRNELSSPGKPLGKERWAAVVDSVGSHTLANACATTKAEGAVAACGLAQGMDFPSTVAPFILRGVTLYGINSVTTPRERRELAWARLASDLATDKLDAITQEIGLARAIDAAPEILAGKIRGRLVVNVNK